MHHAIHTSQGTIKKSIMSIMPQIASETFIVQKVNRKVTFDLI